MKVEVTLENIIRYRLVELTKNSAEKMMHAARLAELEGETLSCEVPEEHLEKLRELEKEAGGVQTANTFDMFGSGQPADMSTFNDDLPLQHGVDSFAAKMRERIREAYPGVMVFGVPDSEPSPDIHVVQGEVVESARIHEINLDPNGLGHVEVGPVNDPMSTSHIPFPPDMVDDEPKSELEEGRDLVAEYWDKTDEE